jgi:hypothetical protein
MRSFHSDNPKARTKQKELVIHSLLQDAGIQFDYQVHVPFKACGLGSETQCAYLDFLIVMPWGYLVLEVDEDQHSHYSSGCDVRRDFDIAASIALGSAQKLAIIHYNPDAYKVAGKTLRTTSKERHQKLMSLIQGMEEPEGLERLFLFYDKESSDATLPSVAKEWSDTTLREVSRCV